MDKVKRFLIFDGYSIPFCVIWTKKYTKKEIEEIINYISILKKKIFSSKNLFYYIDSREYTKYFKILGISSWQMKYETIKKEYDFDIFDKRNKKSLKIKKFFEKYSLIETYKIYKEIYSEEFEFFKNMYKELDFARLENILYEELNKELKLRYKPKNERIMI